MWTNMPTNNSMWFSYDFFLFYITVKFCLLRIPSDICPPAVTLGGREAWHRDRDPLLSLACAFDTGLQIVPRMCHILSRYRSWNADAQPWSSLSLFLNWIANHWQLNSYPFPTTFVYFQSCSPVPFHICLVFSWNAMDASCEFEVCAAHWLGTLRVAVGSLQ